MLKIRVILGVVTSCGSEYVVKCININLGRTCIINLKIDRLLGYL
jgi:hypothetical protein